MPYPFFHSWFIMASGRVGGTRSRISGEVGGEIYQVVRNSDGSFSQVVYVKPDVSQAAITPKLQAQRMCMAMVEALMRDLKPVGRISMQSGVNQSKSLNAFSSNNVMLVAQDCKVHWNGDNQFVYPLPYQMLELGGAYMISSGTLQRNLFKDLRYIDSPFFPSGSVKDAVMWATVVVFDVPAHVQTVGELLRYWGVTRLDKVVQAWYRYYFWTDPESGDMYQGGVYEYIIWNVNPSIHDSAQLTAEIIQSIWMPTTPVTPFASYKPAEGMLYLGSGGKWGVDDNWLYYHAAFSISYEGGKKKISSSRLTMCYTELQWLLDENRPCDNFGGWMGTPGVKPYPNIFV